MRLFNITSNKCLCVMMLLLAPALLAKPVVIAHRGASGYLPENTLAAYEKAIDMGADYIEPDLVITRDGHLIARHDHYLDPTTDVVERDAYADRRKLVDGHLNWFTEDFTLEEIKTLRARQAFPGRSDAHDDRYTIPTLQEIIELVKRKSVASGRTVGIYPEMKVPGYFASRGYDVAALLTQVLDRNDLAKAGIDVFVQSFERSFLERLDGTTDLPLVQLIKPVSGARPNTPNIPLEEIAAYADGAGAFKGLLVDDEGASSGVIERAHELGLFIHAWTFRDDAYPENRFTSGRAEIAHYLKLGIDGFFTDFPDTGVSVRDRYWANHPSDSEWTHYGGEREGDNLYANSLVALHARTGEVVWYRQLVHHDVWDYDLASQPVLVELTRAGETIPAVLQGTKTGMIFSFSRETGKPIFEIEERPVPQNGTPGGVFTWGLGMPNMGGSIVTGGGQATPMTYYLPETDKQYIVIAAGGHPRMGTTAGDYVVAFALP